LIFNTIKKLEETNIIFNPEINWLDNILDLWLQDVEIEKEIKRQASMEGSAKAETVFNLLNFFKTKFSIKTALAANANFSKIIRENVRKNAIEIVRKFNIALDDIRIKINDDNLGRDILFVVDGSEKIYTDVYERIFISDSFVLRDIRAFMICSVPVSSYFTLDHNNALMFYENVFLPVIKVSEKSMRALKEIVEKRIDTKLFFENEETLEFFIEKSGGIIRLLLKLINFALLYKESEKLDMKESKEIIGEYARRMFEHLDNEQISILQKIKDGKLNPNPADKLIGNLIFGLFILKYNGDYKVNPLIIDFL